MDLVTLNSNPLSLSISPSLLCVERLDIDFYLPVRVQAEESVSNGRFKSAPLRELNIKSRPITDGIRRHDKSTDGVCLIRTQNLVGPTIDYTDVAYISAEWHQTSLKSEVKPGDLLVAIRGYLGNAAIVSDEAPRSNINQHIARLSIDTNKCSSPYIWAFLCSKFGQRILERYVTGTVQRGITLPDLRAIRVPLPDRRIQDYIGAKIALAERCRAKAVQFFCEARERFEQLLCARSFEPRTNLTNLIAPNLLMQRLGGEFYLPRYFDLDEHLYSLGMKIETIGDMVRSPILRTTTPDRGESAAIPCILTSDIEPQEINWREPSLRITPSTYDCHNGRLEEYDIVYTSVGPPVGEAAVVLPEHLPLAVGGDVSVIRTGENLHPGFLCLYLNSIFGQMQNDRYSRGIRQRRVYPEDIRSFLIPVPKPADQSFIGERIVRYEQLKEKSVCLINKAKADIEALIEGTLDTHAIMRLNGDHSQ